MIKNTHTSESIGASAAAIEHHYDAGNEFYRLWLDDTMSYTCALFSDAHPEESIEQAQIRKLDYLVDQARGAGAKRVLDIGCGWGNALSRLVGAHQVAQAVGLTLSQQQTQWIERLGDPRIEVRRESWSEHNPVAPYDAILSIEAFEAFARPGLSATQKIAGYRALFERCHAWLRPGGRMALQTIAYGNSGPEDLDEFIASQIFPESDLPRLAEIAEAIERRFEVVTLRNDRAHYARTLRAWLGRLKARRAEASRLIGEEAVVRYERYLRLSTYMFQVGTCDLYRITLQRIDQPRPRRLAPATSTAPIEE